MSLPNFNLLFCGADSKPAQAPTAKHHNEPGQKSPSLFEWTRTPRSRNVVWPRNSVGGLSVPSFCPTSFCSLILRLHGIEEGHRKMSDSKMKP